MPNLKSMAATNPLSPSIPVPDPNAFQAKLGQSDKKRLLLSTYSRCPSPPSKSPPHSRVVNSSRDLYTPFARSLVPSTPYLTTPEQSIFQTPQQQYFSTEASFITGKLLGRGSFFDVYCILITTLCYLRTILTEQTHSVKSRADGQTYALKQRKKKFHSNGDRDKALEEARVALQLPAHENIVRTLSAWEEKGHLYILTELCECNLRDYIAKVDVIPEEHIWCFLKDIAMGLKHIHDNRLIHLDIKPANILISPNFRLKIGDFGQAIYMDKWRPGTEVEGDSCYMAPELMEEQYSRVTPAVDVFSLGATLFEMAVNTILTPQDSALYEYLRSGNVRISTFPKAPQRSRELEELIAQLLRKKPEERPTMAQILKHPKVVNAMPLAIISDNNNNMSMEIESPSGSPEYVYSSDEDVQEVYISNKRFNFREQQRRDSYETEFRRSNSITSLEDHSSEHFPIQPRNLMTRFEDAED